MDIPHRPDPSTLMTCAAGSQPEALCAVITSCLSMCPISMDQVSRMEMIGAALLAQIDPEPMAAVRGQRPVENENYLHEKGRESGLPAPLRAVIGNSLMTLQWIDRTDGVKYCGVPMSSAAQGRLELVKLAPGKTLPELAYAGEEYLLVLHGTCTRDGDRLERGDFAESFEQTSHEITATLTSECILLIGHERLPHQPIRDQ